MTPFSIKFDTDEEYQDIKKRAVKYGYKEIFTTLNHPFKWISFFETKGYSEYQNIVFLLDKAPLSRQFNWGMERKEAIKFMKKNSPLHQAKKQDKKIKQDHATEFWNKCFGVEEKGVTKEQIMGYAENLEERIHKLEQALGRNWKRVKDVDHKLRSRIQMLESRFDIHENNGVHAEKKESYSKFVVGQTTPEPLRVGQTGRELKAMFDELKRAQEVQDRYAQEFFARPPKIPEQKDEIKSKIAPKIAIRVENKHEFSELMDIYDKKGWSWLAGEKPHKGPEFSSTFWGGESIISFSDKCRILDNRVEYDGEFTTKSYQIIPLQTLKAILS